MLVEVLAADLAFGVVALGLGEAILGAGEKVAGAASRPPSLQRFGTALLIGFGGCASLGIALAAMRLFDVAVLASCGAAVVVLTRRHLRAYGAALIRVRRSVDPLVVAVAAVGGIVVVFQWLAALAPSEATDELAYHLPEARSLAHGHVLMLGSDHIYGNLPALLEVLYGEALPIRGAALAHTLHLLLLLAFLPIAAAVARRLWGTRAAAIACLGILLYSDLLDNATTAYVDAGTAAFEAAAVLLTVAWLVDGEDGDVVAAALLIGFALAAKYDALVGAVLMAAAVGIVLVRRRSGVRLLAALAGLALAGCAYWYGKNLLRFGNPFYPLLFRHPGISDATLHYFVGTVQAYGSRSATTFAEVPTRFANDANGTAFLGYALAPLALLARGPRRAAAILLAFVAVGGTVWFWLQSNQTRFLYAPTIVAIVLGAAALAATRPRALALVASVAAAALVGAQLHTSGFSVDAPAAVRSWLDSPKSRYALDLESTHAYLERYFGCQVDAVELLSARRLRGNVALWDLSAPPGYPRDNLLAPIDVTATTTSAARQELRERGVRFALAQGMSVDALSSNPVALPILRAARRFWSKGDCSLYRLPA